MKKMLSLFMALPIILSFTGCGSSELAALSTLGQLSPHTTPEEKAAWAAIGTASRMEHEKQVAREGRTQVNINIPSNVVRTSDGKLSPANGYRWANQNPGDYAVVPVSKPSTLWETYAKDGFKAADQGHFFDAESLFKAAVREEEGRDPRSYHMGQTMYWLGMSLEEQGKKAEANSAFSKAFSILDQHPNIKDEKKAEVLYKVAFTAESKENNSAVIESQIRKVLELANCSEEGKPKSVCANAHLYLARKYRDKNDYDSAIAHYSEGIRMFPDHAPFFYERAFCYERLKDYNKQSIDLEAALIHDSGNPLINNAVAWFLATCPDNEFRNGQRAVVLATKAAVSTARENPYYLDTLAAALAEAGNFERAITVQEEAIQLLKDPVQIEDYRKRLSIFRQGLPYRDTD